jgi:hypothetical protein
MKEWGPGNTGKERYRVERRISSRQRRHQDGETQQRSESGPGSSSSFRGVEVVLRSPGCPSEVAGVGCRRRMLSSSSHVRYEGFQRRWITPQICPIRSALTGRPNPPLPHSHSRHGSPPSLIQRGPDLAQKHLAIIIRGIRAFGGMRVSACSAIVRSGWAGTSGHSEAV